ncbi:hypothetical protein [Nocardia sp. NPDC058497]|uniref:hypothetical protein n=1 Tax=Nocardia sp. NPDC058497 TaxID=3346529 RepID=UPI0036659404
MGVATVVTWVAALILSVTQALDSNLLLAVFATATTLAAGTPWLVLALLGVVKYRAVAVSSILPLIIVGVMVAGVNVCRSGSRGWCPNPR